MPISNSKSIAVFLPTRKGSERVLNKNTRQFAGEKDGLLGVKLKQLQKLDGVRTYLSTNDEASIEVAKEFLEMGMNIRIVHRPEELCTSQTRLKDLINYVPSIIEEEHILWTHVTSPFVEATQYKKAIELYFSNSSHDSLMSVSRVQEFLWSEKEKGFVNFTRTFGEWPRTQDLDVLYAVNSAIFIAGRNTYLKGDRIGKMPALIELSAKAAIDIDREDDFELAELIYNGAN